MHIISIAAQKGGVGKTTTAVHVATALREKGHEPLVVDFDAQMNATIWLLGRTLKNEEASVFDSLSTYGTGRANRFTLSALIESSEQLGVDFVPSSSKMAGPSFKLIAEDEEHYPLQLHYRLEELKAESGPQSGYDICLLDCPPSLGAPVLVALSASDEVIAPITTDNFSMRGLNQLFETIELVQEKINPMLGVLGFVINNIDLRRRMANDLVDSIQEQYQAHVFETVIPWRASIVDTATIGQSLYDAKPNGDAAGFYLDLAGEIVSRIQNRETDA